MRPEFLSPLFPVLCASAMQPEGTDRRSPACMGCPIKLYSTVLKK